MVDFSVGERTQANIPDWLLLMALDNNPSRQGVACPPHTLLRGHQKRRVSGEHIRTGDHVGRTFFLFLIVSIPPCHLFFGGCPSFLAQIPVMLRVVGDLPIFQW